MTKVNASESYVNESRPWVLFCFLGTAAFAHAAMLAASAQWHSPSIDETGHLAAGLSHWKYGRVDLYVVNPPLVRSVAGLPLSVMDIQADWRGYYAKPDSRSEFRVGEDFILANERKAFDYFAIARWACIPLSLLGAFVCFRWGRDLYGDKAGLLAAVLWCFSPTMMASAGMITPDCGAAALGVLACYLFWLWLREPTWERGFFAGIGLGLAELTKFTWIILFPLWLGLWVIYRRRADGRNRRKEMGQMAVMVLLAVYLINTGYGYEGSFTKLKEFEFFSETLGGPDEGKTAETGNRFRDSILGELPVPVPRNYVLGIDVQKRDFERGMRSYLRGEWKRGGWWYYYLYALLVKVPVGTWMLFLLAVSLSFRGRPQGAEEPTGLRRPLAVTWRDELVLLAPAIVIIVLVSSQTGFNHHLRYILPAFPFGFIFISKVGAHLSWSRKSLGSRDSDSPGMWLRILASGALLWSVGSSLWVYPHSMSYFNEFAGGPLRGHEHLVDSNIDWGQDLLYLKDWYDEHPRARPFHLAYFGGFDPHAAGFEYELPPDDPRPGWHAVSVNLMRGMQFGVYDGRGRKQFSDEDRFTYFQQFEPVARAGYSIYIYRITEEDAERVRKELGLEPSPPPQRESRP